MPLQNRVLPTGEIVADPARGIFTGNRGIIHRSDGTLGTSRWSHQHWLVCTLTHPRNKYHEPMPHRAWTALFFLDEAVALTAGHRPCHYCRRSASQAFRTAWEAAHGPVENLPTVDRVLHKARVTRQRKQVRFEAEIDGLPDHVFVLINGQAHRLDGDLAFPYRPAGYEAPIARPSGRCTVLTPRPMVGVLAAGFEPVLRDTP